MPVAVGPETGEASSPLELGVRGLSSSASLRPAFAMKLDK